MEFSIVLHKRALYPNGHPHLQESSARFVNRLESLLENREELMIGIARHQLIVGGVATDARNALLSDLRRAADSEDLDAAAAAAIRLRAIFQRQDRLPS